MSTRVYLGNLDPRASETEVEDEVRAAVCCATKPPRPINSIAFSHVLAAVLSAPIW